MLHSMHADLPITMVLAVPPTLQRWWDAALWSWNHHDTLKFLVGGVFLLGLAAFGKSREWGGVMLTLLMIAGLGGLVTGGAMALLGDEARKGRAIIRAGKVAVDGACKSDGDCDSGVLCVSSGSDETLRCRVQCRRDADCRGGTCSKVSGGRVCLK